MKEKEMRKKSIVEFEICKCDACGACLDVCPQDALSIYHKGFVIQEDCNGCGNCVEVYDKDALHFAGRG